MIIGTPTDRQQRCFELMPEVQQIAFDAIRPGAGCCDVDQAVTAPDTRRNLMDHWRRHTGRALGGGIHQALHSDVGEPTPIRPGMVFSVEPEIFPPGYAGSRHSDPVLVTELLTPYPRALEVLPIRV